ncbi:FAD/FMN-containing dehydrogenase [Salinihabitans flavidus]|uniref:FAD/FMN-containing dehydrogenase n=1 Tax=Salinihabitans flavidus TaxID=569882 RepID=A0A1H8RDD7_9RHOB|nr:FAD-binding oxidoreductase [Salinihabitans flavidus]SEO64013.1 FAD/FMN-containing dehydrogenase [Salinihabitans flavidus]
MTEQPSISGKSDIDWPAFAAALAPVETIAEPVLVKKRSRDFFWYSPILNQKLRTCFGDLVARPKTRAELAHCLAVAWRHDAPVTLRGGGTGNYGQSVPLHGGLIVETTDLNRVLEIGPDFVRAEAGALMADVNTALADAGQEMAMFPSTQDIATIGGFVAGGSAGIGSVANGPLRQTGNILQIKAFSVEERPVEHVFGGSDVLRIHHAWGLNGVISEVTLRTVPRRDWISCMATFDSYGAAYRAGLALAESTRIDRKLASVVDARITGYFPRLTGHIRPGKHLLVSLVPREDLDAFRTLIAAQGGYPDLTLQEAEREALNIPHVFEFAWNHTTLQVLKADRTATYQQYGVNDPADAAGIEALHDKLGDRVWMHHEFSRYDGRVTASDLPIIWFEGEDHLRQTDRLYAANGCTVYDAHTNEIEGGGMKPDYRHLALKKRMDPKGLLNMGKSRAWDAVRHLPPEEIAALAAPTA